MRYGVMSNCLEYRAVHLEIGDWLDLESFVNVFSHRSPLFFQVVLQ
jgi:hypothetical protein